MNTHLSEDTAMQALQAARPDSDAVDAVWSPTRANRVLGTVLDQTVTEPQRTTPHISRRWALAAAVAGIATIGLIGQAVVPSGSLGSATAAQALDRLANRAVAITIPDGKLLKAVTSYTLAPNDDNPLGERRLTTTWYAPDGWAWSSVRYNDSGESYVRDKWPSDPYVALLPQPLPADPAAAVAAIKQRAADYVVQRPNKVTRAIAPDLWVAYVADAAFEDVRTSAADRALLIRCLALLSDVTVDEHATDPLGRPAVEVTMKYQEPVEPYASRELRLFLDEKGLVLACQDFNEVGQVIRSWTTERSLVDSVPTEVVKLVGSGHKTKAVTR